MVFFVLHLCYIPQLASSVTLTAVLNPSQDFTQADYEELHVLSINYPQNSEIGTLFKNNADKVTIAATSLSTEKNEIKQ